ncbi:ADP-ribosylglycohydrolase family protein [Methylocystis rosea]|uniref:ADP-ribosylglycohydrolase family protein n=1 Tax=Methylocystis rosea TaxID=173366 RepID=A0A3G8MAT5_9HYPH|nr:ADP-ribosylglycohydrolase family protein [Methylocystis rosea]AZG78967.1 ADP-ribosylglycohydrolase family protein [Methylocystis rosea]
MRLSLEDRLFGCLLGQAVGDALGFPVEGRPPTICAAYVDDVLRRGRARSVSAESFAFGQYTDDTQLARELVISYVNRQGFDPADYGKRIAAIFVEGRIVGRGRITEAAAWRLAQGVPWNEAGASAPAVGNGGASRAGPIGVLYNYDGERRKQVAADQSRITHTDPRAVAGSVAIASAVALAGQTIQFDRTNFVEALSEEVASTNDGFTQALRRLPTWLRLHPHGAATEIAAAGLGAGEYRKWDGISPFVTSSVLWALYSFLRSPDDYWETILTAIAVGGDVDTTAAMAGAIAGARLGPAAIPAQLVRHIHDRGTWKAFDLKSLARDASQIAQRTTTPSQPAPQAGESSS